ncbi:exonuclease 1 isoform X1 [Rhopalosiphum maidis]|uniref:exonuclease 1 isoform X1 n=1 Tax=Rhopalosiphum maidis TaxID=43146 RepID=UPI000EFF9DCF|nr:exonuclease 1 isoform X1 [Rhopalosiphum maidis]
MGIQGLIPLLEKSWRTVNVSEFSGCTVAIDAYCWLHKGVYTCAEKLARGEDCQAYVYYCMRFVSMLLAQNIKPILVFDGQHLPAKADTELKRRKLREQNRKKAAELMRLDKGKEASSLLRRSIDVTHKMALNLIKRCREINVDCIVAPYEADSQLAYLNLSGIAHIVITEDSDLLLFGCKRVLFKMDQNGAGILIEQEKLHLSMNIQPEQFSLDKFRYMCILSGCDYLPSISGIGLIKARQFITRTSEPDIYKALSRLGSFMNIKIPPEYRDQFMDADRMFQYQPVFDPLSRRVIPLNEISDPNLPVLVSKLSSNQAYQLALGNIDPFSLEIMDNWDPDIQLTPEKIAKKKIIQARHKSIWSKDYQPFKYNPEVCTLTQEIIKTPTMSPKVSKNVIPSSPIHQPPVAKKRLPVTEDDILNTLDEIYENEKVSEKCDIITEEKHKSTKSAYLKDCKITNESLKSEFNIDENESPSFLKQLTKRKYTVIDPDVQIVSGYFSPQVPKINDVFEEESINPFKSRKITIHENKNINDDKNIFLNTNNINEGNLLQLSCLENEEVKTKTFNKKLPSQTLSAFSWKSYSNNRMVTNKELNEEQKYQNNSNDCTSVDNDTKKVDHENDIDEGFGSQSTKETSNSPVETPKHGKRSYPRTGLSKSTGKNSQTLLSKFGFKTGDKLKR